MMLGRAMCRGAAIATLTVFGAGCFSSGDPEAAASARAKASEDWNLQLEWQGETVELPLGRMDIFLVEEEEEYPEIYEIWGDDAVLVGEFPMDVHVGYEEDLELLIGQSIPVHQGGGDPREPKESFVVLDGEPVAVEGGTIRFEKVTGKWMGDEGDRTLWGDVDLRINDASGPRHVSGTIAVHVVPWG